MHETSEANKRHFNLGEKGEKNAEIGTEMFSQDSRRKQMRDLKAKPAVSTLKTVHTNYFPGVVSTFLPRLLSAKPPI